MRATNPRHDPNVPHPNPMVHGPAQCPHRCGTCEHGEHHWIETGFDPEDTDPDVADDHAAVREYDRINGTEHGLAYYGCKHCPAWAEHDTFDDEMDEESVDIGGEG